MTVAALLALAALVAQDPAALQARAEERRAEVGARCHIDSERLEARLGEDRSYALLTIKGHTALSDAQLRCYADALGEVDRVWPSIDDGRLTRRYDWLVTRDRLREARADLRRRGVLAVLPRLDRRRETLEAFAVRLEALCGAARHSVLFVRDGWIALADDAFSEARRDLFDREECAREAATVAGFDPWIPHVFVGSPFYGPDPVDGAGGPPAPSPRP